MKRNIDIEDSIDVSPGSTGVVIRRINNWVSIGPGNLSLPSLAISLETCAILEHKLKAIREAK